MDRESIKTWEPVSDESVEVLDYNGEKTSSQLYANIAYWFHAETDDVFRLDEVIIWNNIGLG